MNINTIKVFLTKEKQQVYKIGSLCENWILIEFQFIHSDTFHAHAWYLSMRNSKIYVFEHVFVTLLKACLDISCVPNQMKMKNYLENSKLKALIVYDTINSQGTPNNTKPRQKLNNCSPHKDLDIKSLLCRGWIHVESLG